MKYILMLALLFPAYSYSQGALWTSWCNLDAGPEEKATDVNMKGLETRCRKYVDKRAIVLPMAAKKYKEVTRNCATKKEFKKYGLKKWERITGFWRFDQTIDGWLIYTNDFSKLPLRKQFLVSVRQESLLDLKQSDLRKGKSKLSVIFRSYCIGRLENGTIEFQGIPPISVQRYEAFYPYPTTSNP